MPIFIAALLGALVQAALSTVGRVLVGLGIGVVAYSGMSLVLNEAKTRAFQFMDQASSFSQIGQFMGLLQIGTCFNIMFSAITIRFVLAGLTGDTVKKWVTK